MTDLSFTINSHDYASLVDAHNCQTSLTPVEGSRYTDLDKVEHVAVVRHRGALSVQINPVDETKVAALCADLITAPVTVTYYSFQRGCTVTETMMPDAQAIKDAFRFLNKKYVEGFTIKLTEL